MLEDQAMQLELGPEFSDRAVGVCVCGEAADRLPIGPRRVVCAYAVDGAPDELFRAACARGDLWSAQWLTDAFDLTTTVVRALDGAALKLASAQLAVVQWMIGEFCLKAGDIRVVFGAACARGALDVAAGVDARSDQGRPVGSPPDCRVRRRSVRGGRLAGPAVRSQGGVREVAQRRVERLESPGESGPERVQGDARRLPGRAL